MKKTVLSLIGLNLLLAGYLVFALTNRNKPAPPQPASEAVSAPRVAVSIPTPRPARANPKSDRVTWGALASADLRKYAENLRRIGCPDQTIKDIMSAEVNRRYASQERALKVRPDDVAPWEVAASADRRGNEAKLRQLLEEKRTLLKDLTGEDVGIDMPSRLAGRDVEKFEHAFGAISADKRDQVRAIQENYWTQSDDIKQRTMGYLEPEDRDEFNRIKTERHDALAKLLSARELQDFEMQTSSVTSALRSRFEGFDVTDDELRKVFDVMQPLDDKFSLSRRNPDPEDAAFTAARTQAEKDLQDQIRNVLGDDRYAEYQRSRDPVYRGINQAGTEAGLPKETILEAYQAQQQMQQESKRVLQDGNLTPEQRAQAINDMRAQAQQKMQQIFGDKASAMLQRLPGQLADRYGLTPRLQGIPQPVDQSFVVPIQQ